MDRHNDYDFLQLLKVACTVRMSSRTGPRGRYPGTTKVRNQSAFDVTLTSKADPSGASYDNGRTL
jgi:hypothetical protein